MENKSGRREFHSLDKFVYKDCGHKFIGLDVERNAADDSNPVVRCPKCGSTHTAHRFSLSDILLRIIATGTSI